MDLDYETFFFLFSPFAKNRHDEEILKPPGIPTDVDIYHVQLLVFHTIECLSLDYFLEKMENRYKGTYHFKCHLSECR